MEIKKRQQKLHCLQALTFSFRSIPFGALPLIRVNKIEMLKTAKQNKQIEFKCRKQ